MDWRDRVLKLMKDRGIKTRNDLCLKAGISAGSLNMALTGTHELKLSTMGKLAEALDTTTRWLLYGDGTVEARKLPIVNKFHLTGYLLTGNDPDNCQYVEIGHHLSFSRLAFAWVNQQDDLFPEFYRDDVLVIESCDPKIIDIYQPSHFLALSGHCKLYGDLFSFNECFRAEKLKLFVGKAVNISSDLYFETHKMAPELFRFPQDDHGKFCIPVGIVVQLIRTLVHH